MLEFLRTREWILIRRLILVGIVIFLAYRSYGDSLLNLVRGPNPKRDISITHAEFRADVPGEKPVWIIRLRNSSGKVTYDNIQLEAVYFDKQGVQVDKDKLVVHQRLAPGEETTIGSTDFKTRGAAVSGTLKVLDAAQSK